MSWMIALVVLAPLLAADPALPNPRCAPGLYLHQPSNSCMSPTAQDYVNCVTAIFKVSPPLLQTFNKTLNENGRKISGGLALGLFLKEGDVHAAIEETQRKAAETHETFAQASVDGCRPVAVVWPPPPLNDGRRVSPAVLRCASVQIAEPRGVNDRVTARRLPPIATPFEVQWEPSECEATVEVVSMPGVLSGTRADPGRGDLQIRLFATTPDHRLLAQKWVRVEPPPEPPPTICPLPPPPRLPEPQVRITASKPDVGAHLLGKEGIQVPLKLGETKQIQPGDYQLFWSNSSRPVPVTAKAGVEYWADQEALSLPAVVRLIAPSAPTTHLTSAGVAVIGQQEYQLSPPTTTLKLSLLDREVGIAELQITPAVNGGVEVKVEAVPRKPSYLPAWVGAGGAALAGALWLAWLRPAASSAQDHYDQLGAGDDFAAGRDRATTTAMRANVALGVAFTSLAVGAVVQVWELQRSAP